MSLQNAFDFVFSLKAKTYEVTDRDTPATYSLKLAPSNFFRDFAGPEQVSYPGREFVVSGTAITEAAITNGLKKGFVIKDTQTNEIYIIEEIREMYEFNAKIVGYRIRTN
jgi:hypothetical protein